MPLDEDATEEIKSAIAIARKRDLNFGLCLGKKFDTCVLVTHRKKSPEVLARQAKKEGETAKLAFGTLRVKGKVMSLTCDDVPPAGCARKTKDFLSKTVGIKMKVQLLDSTGNVLEATEDDEDGVDAQDATDDVGDAARDPAEAKWASVEKKLKPLIEAAIADASLTTDKLDMAWTMAQRRVDEGQFSDALKIAAKLPPLLKGDPKDATAAEPEAAAEAPGPAQKQWDKTSPKVTQLYEAVMKTNPADRSKLTAAWGMAVERAEGGDHAGALKVLERLVPTLKKLLADSSAGAAASPEAETTAPTGEPPKGVVAFQKARVLWSGTRTKMKAEVGKLEKAIIEMCGADDDFQEVVTNARNLSKRLDVFDDRLEDTLDEITNTPDGPEREKLKITAKKQIGEYATALKDGFFQDIDSNNGFIPISVASTASQSLKEIAATLR